MQSSSMRAASTRLIGLAQFASVILCAGALGACAVQSSDGENAEQSSAALGLAPITSFVIPQHPPICETLATCDGMATVHCGAVPGVPPFDHVSASLYIGNLSGGNPFHEWTPPNSFDKTSFNWSELNTAAHSETFLVCATGGTTRDCLPYTVNFPAPVCGTQPPKNCSVQNPAPGCVSGGGGGGLAR